MKLIFFLPIPIFLALNTSGCKKSSNDSSPQEPIAQTEPSKPVPPPENTPIEESAAPQTQPRTSYAAEMNRLAAINHELLKEKRLQEIHQVSISGSTPMCKDGVECPAWSEGIGQVTTSLGTCVATLVAKDVIITAGHCIGNLKDGESLQGTFSLASIKSKTRKLHFELVSLRHLIMKRVSTNPMTDFAIVALSRSIEEQRPLKLSREGFKNNTLYANVGEDLLSTSPTFHKWHLRKTCYSSYRNILFPEFDHPQDAFVGLSDCPIGAGNSGAPLLNDKNEVVGIVRGHINQQSYFSAHDHLHKMGFIKSENNAFLAGATNVACIPDVLDGQPVVTEACNGFGGEYLNLAPGIAKPVDEEILQLLKKKTGATRFFRIANSLSMFRTSYVKLPECFQRKDLSKVAGSTDTYFETEIYSPVISERFEITSTLAPPVKVKGVFNETTPTSDSYPFFIKLQDLPWPFEGTVKVCAEPAS